jgi:hypothetical protein
MAVSLKANGAALTLGQPVPMFEVLTNVGGYDVSPDGKRFLATSARTASASWWRSRKTRTAARIPSR